MKKNKKSRRFEYAIAVQEPSERWTVWLQADEPPTEDEAEAAEAAEAAPLVGPHQRFDEDVAMLGYMSRAGWELVTGVGFHDGWPRLLFKRRVGG